MTPGVASIASHINAVEGAHQQRLWISGMWRDTDRYGRRSVHLLPGCAPVQRPHEHRLTNRRLRRVLGGEIERRRCPSHIHIAFRIRGHGLDRLGSGTPESGYSELV